MIALREICTLLSSRFDLGNYEIPQWKLSSAALNDARLTHSWPLEKIQHDTEQQSDDQQCLLDQRLETEPALPGG